MASFTLSKGPLRLRVSLTWSERVHGITSKLPNGRHILMWDFDNSTLEQVFDTLAGEQRFWSLARIHVFSGGRPGSYHAYCLEEFDFIDAVGLIYDTEGVDRGWVKLAFIREYFTLRTSTKDGRAVNYEGFIDQYGYGDKVDPSQLEQAVDYWTKVLNHS